MPLTSRLPLRAALPWLLVITGMFFLNFTARLIFSPLLPLIEADMGINHAQASRLLFFLYAAFGSSLFFSGYVACRMRHRSMIVVSTVGMGVGLILVALSQTLWQMSGAMVLLGAMGGFYLPSGLASLTSLVQPQHYGRAMSIHELAPNFSFICSPLLIEALLRVTDWRTSMLLVGVVMISLALVFAKWGRGGDGNAERPKIAQAKAMLHLPAFWALLGLFMLAVGASMTPYIMLPLYLMEAHAYTREEASHLLTLSRLSGPVVTVIAGLTIDSVGARRTIALYLVFTAVTTAALGFAEGDWLVAAVVAQPVCSVFFFPAGFAYIAGLFTDSQRGLAISCIIPAAIILGNGGIPQVLGWLGDRDAFHLGFYGIGVLSLCALFLVHLLEPPPAPAAEQT